MIIDELNPVDLKNSVFGDYIQRINKDRELYFELMNEAHINQERLQSLLARSNCVNRRLLEDSEFSLEKRNDRVT